VATVRAQRAAGALEATLVGELKALGEAAAVEVGFEYRRKKATEELLNKDAPWQPTPLVKRQGPGEFSVQVKGLTKAEAYEFRAVVKHPLLTVFGEEKPLADQR